MHTDRHRDRRALCTPQRPKVVRHGTLHDIAHSQTSHNSTAESNTRAMPARTRSSTRDVRRYQLSPLSPLRPWRPCAFFRTSSETPPAPQSHACISPLSTTAVSTTTSRRVVLDVAAPCARAVPLYAGRAALRTCSPRTARVGRPPRPRLVHACYARGEQYRPARHSPCMSTPSKGASPEWPSQSIRAIPCSVCATCARACHARQGNSS